MTDPPPSPSLKRPDLAKAFDDVVARATAKDPRERYSKASELAAAVDRAVAEQRSQLAPDALQVTRAAGAPPVHDVFIAEPTQPPQPAAPVPARDEPQRTVAPPDEPPRTVPPPPRPPSGDGPAGPPQPAGAPAAGGPGRRRGLVVAGLAVLVGGAAAAVALIAGSSDGGSGGEDLGERVPATLGPVPTNRVDGLGDATIRLNGNVATVSLKTNGLVDGEPHAMHIHAGEKGACPTVQAAKQHNGKLHISTLDGAAFYGHPRVSLTTRGDIGVVSILEFARYPTKGDITYKRTMRLRPRTARFIRRNLAVIVVHGIDYNGNGAYDDTLGGSDLNPALVGEATAPALCGELVAGGAAQQSAQRQGPSGAGVYTASLNLPPTAPSWLCHLRRTS